MIKSSWGFPVILPDYDCLSKVSYARYMPQADWFTLLFIGKIKHLSLKMLHRMICDLSISQALSHFSPKVLPREQGQRSGAGVSYREGLVTRDVLLLGCSKFGLVVCVRNCGCSWSLLDVCHISCIEPVLANCTFITAPGPGGCTGCAGAGDLLWDPGGIQPAGMCCAAGKLGRNVGGMGGMQGVLSHYRGWVYGRDPDTRRWAGGLEKGRKQEDGKMQREKETCPGYASLLAAGARPREHRGWQNCWTNGIRSVKWEWKTCQVETV